MKRWLPVSVAAVIVAAAAMASIPRVLNVTLLPQFGTLSTCSAILEGGLEVDVLSGVSTGKRTKLCLCTSDGSATYKWQNVATATLGTTTTCGTE